MPAWVTGETFRDLSQAAPPSGLSCQRDAAGERTLLPGDDAALGEIRFAGWPGRYGPGR